MKEAKYLVEIFKVEKVIFNCGDFNDLEKDLIEVLDKKKNCFTYMRTHRDAQYIIDCNLGKEERKAFPVGKDYKLVMPARVDSKNMLGAYEARVYVKK